MSVSDANNVVTNGIYFRFRVGFVPPVRYPVLCHHGHRLDPLHETQMAPSEFWLDFVAGWVSGAVSVLVVQPVDTTLTRMQAIGIKPGIDTSARSVFTTVLKQGGTKALWRGTGPMTAVIPFQNALLFAGYGGGERWAKQLASNKPETDRTPDLFSLYAPIFAGGCLGGVAQSFAVSPFELLKIKQQSATINSGNVFAVAKQVTKQLGTGVFSKGLGSTLLRDGVPHGVWFVAYEWSKRKLENRVVVGDVNDVKTIETKTNAPPQQTTVIPLAAGAFAAAVAWGVGYPFDTIKTRIQASALAEKGVNGVMGKQSEQGVISMSRTMIRENNGNVIKGLYRGFGLKLLRAVPASAVAFFAYEESRRWLG